MQYKIAVTATDAVNKYNMKIEDGAFINNMIERGDGISHCIGHDMHRPIGWVNIFGVLSEPKLSSLIAIIESPESDDDWDKIKKWHKANLIRVISESTSKSIRELIEYLSIKNDGSWKVNYSGCPLLIKENIAKQSFENLFEKADDDGLILLSDILHEFDYLGEGIFAHKRNNLVVFAHKYFRRRLSYANSFRIIFLDALVATHKANSFNVKIRLDLDSIGWKTDFRNTIELEYWYGPKFNDDISNIDPGVSHHEASESEKFFELICRTEFFWYSRDNQHTFECEEIIMEPSLGVSSDRYGCRYIHSIYDYDSKCINHFDAAIRMYSEEKYIERLDNKIDNAGKDTDYTKLFRMDGHIPVSLWKELCVLYMQGNSLISEYFGIKQFESDENIQVNDEANPGSGLINAESGPIALISISNDIVSEDEFAELDTLHNSDGTAISVIDADAVELIKEFKEQELSPNHCDARRISIPDRHINLPTIKLATRPNFHEYQRRVVKAICAALSKLSNKFSKDSSSLSIMWPFESQSLKIALAGKIPDLIEILTKIQDLPTTKDALLSANQSIKGILDEKPELKNCIPASFIDLSGNLRQSRLVVPDNFIVIKDNKISLTQTGLEFSKSKSLIAAVGTLINVSRCSICGSDYSNCTHQRFITNECYEEISDYKIVGVFWSRQKAE